MSSTYICSTRRGDYNAMRFQGILVTESHAQIASMLEKSLSRDHALLFAEPVHDASGESTDWYSERQGTPIRLVDLPEVGQQALRKRIAALASDIKNLADGLMADEGQAKKIRGNILSLALLCPGVEHIYSVDGEPVLTAWGFGPGSAGARPEDLVRLGAALPLAGTPPAGPAEITEERQAARSGPGWFRSLLALLLGLLCALALFFLLCLLFGPSGCAAPGALPPGCSKLICPAVPPERAAPPRVEEKDTPAPSPELARELAAEQEKERALRQQLEDLRARLADRIAQCPRTPAKPVEIPGQTEVPVLTPEPEQPKAEGPAEPEQTAGPEEAPAEEPLSLADLMPTTPDPPPAPREEPKKEEPKKETKPKDDEKPLARGEEMRIPDKAKKNKDLSFLDGCWTSETGLVSTRDREPINVQYCFDKSGNGNITITETRRGTRCQGSAKARFDASGKLILDTGRSACNSGGAYVPQHVECTTDSSGKAQCYGKNNQGRQWRAVFRRQ